MNRVRQDTKIQRTRDFRRPAIWLLAALSLNAIGCSGLNNGARVLFERKVQIEVFTTPDLNRDFPLAVDFVVAYDEDLFEELMKLDAQTWFASRAQFLKDFEKEMKSHYWEWVPGRHVEPKTVRYQRGAHGGVVFAHYFTPGEHRVAIDPLKGFILRLGDSDFTVEPRRK